MTIKLGVIAEDQGDVDVILELIKKRQPKFSVDQFLGKGCGKIKSKCAAWAKNLRARGCNRLIIVQDADAANPAQLLGELQAALGPSPIPLHVVVVPVREVEAWLLADHAAIKAGMKIRGKVKKVANPEVIFRPKEHLRDLSARLGKPYLNTVHNKEIAKHSTFAALRRCPSFLPFETFVINHM